MESVENFLHALFGAFIAFCKQPVWLVIIELVLCIAVLLGIGYAWLCIHDHYEKKYYKYTGWTGRKK